MEIHRTIVTPVRVAIAMVLLLSAATSVRAQDCNGNGVPDVQDIDPADPDGNGEVSPDCNGNGAPDECEFSPSFLADFTQPSSAFNEFGNAVAIDGDFAVVGDLEDDERAQNAGAAYIFKRVNGVWTQVTKLTLASGQQNDYFGCSVAIDGDTAMVGAYWEDPNGVFNGGAVYVYEEADGSWPQVAMITPDDSATNRDFGWRVALHGTTCAISTSGVPASGFDDTAVYVFEESGGVWSQVARLIPDDPETSDGFGDAVALDGATILVGAPSRYNYSFEAGVAYAFEKVNDVWSQTAKFSAPDPGQNANFGDSVSVDGPTVAIAAPRASGGGTTYGGAVYVFERQGGDWGPAERVAPPTSGAFQYFGSSVSVRNDLLLVGAEGEDGIEANAGAAYVFRHVGGQWRYASRFEPSSPTAESDFGYSVAFDGGIACVGAPFRLTNSLGGHVYFVDISNLSLDCNANGVPDDCDIASLTSGDCDSDGVPDECETDCNGDGTPDECENPPPMWVDCNGNGASDLCDLSFGAAMDCNVNGIPDSCELPSLVTLLESPLAEGGGFFGSQIAMDGDTAAISAPGVQLGEDFYRDSGLVFVYRHVNDEWLLEATLSIADPTPGVETQFAGHLALDGDRLVVSGRTLQVGAQAVDAVYLFERIGGAWLQTTALIADGADPSDNFGAAFDVSGDTVVVGAPYDDMSGMNNGSAYIFRKTGGVWTQTQKLVPVYSFSNAMQVFGYSVSLDGATLAVGAPADDQDRSNSGAVYVFSEDIDGVWRQVSKLKCQSQSMDANLGYSVAIDGHTIVAGAPYEGPTWQEFGAVYVFEESNGAWRQTFELHAPDESTNSAFGGVLSLTDSTLVVGYAYISDPNVSSRPVIYVFRKNAGLWRLIRAVDDVGHGPGPSAATNGTTVLAGLPSWGAQTYAGAVAVFDLDSAATDCFGAGLLDECQPDCNGDGVPDACELLNEPGRDCNENGILDDCELASGGVDCNQNGILDECELSAVVTQKLTAVAGARFDQFGAAVAIDQDIAMIGPTAISTGGAVQVYRRVGGAWTFMTQLVPDDAAGPESFGLAIALRGATAAIASPTDSDNGNASGAVYLLEETTGEWLSVAKLTADDSAANDKFGSSVAFDGETLVVGSPFDDDTDADSGSAYVFRKTNGVWTQLAKLTAQDAAASDRFGSEVAVDRDVVIIGAPYVDEFGSDSGAVYVFHEVGGFWTQIAKWIPSDGVSGDRFGECVAVHGSSAIVGAPYRDNAGNSSGGVYFFERFGSDWQPVPSPAPSDAQANDLFGYAVALEFDTAIIGATGSHDTLSGAGAAYLARRINGAWRVVDKFDAPDAGASSQFGASVALSGNSAVAGAFGDYVNGLPFSGSAYLADLPPRDCNENGIPDDCELNGADCNSNGRLDACEIANGDLDDCNMNGTPDSCESIQTIEAFVEALLASSVDAEAICLFDTDRNGTLDARDIHQFVVDNLGA
ncbi:MAG TPA: FG-GAP repeat protein [Phycisphaerae bacterium]|nr:FG-GAP repeat protein [Phycisphaerae bacterium]HRW52908.1 FG-GAP repeat protein [Phycisphaerae bacterium]